MSRATVTTTERADQDIRTIFGFIAFDNPGAAVKFAAELDEAFRRIGNFPEAGHRFPGLGPEISALRVSQSFNKYLIFYRNIGPENVQVLRVVHGARDYAKLFGEGGA